MNRTPSAVPPQPTSSAQPNDIKWWQQAVVYEIAPISFQDSNGDGLGDLPGLIERFDYLSWLGIDTVWLTPVYPSPMLDLGYDIADFCGVDPLFGTLADFDRLLELLHARDIRLILDFVPNHTSDQHPWFCAESGVAREFETRLVCLDGSGPDGGAPNNWLSRFGGSAWQCDETTGEYYYHSFLAEQPDLNWRNPAVRAAMADVLRFWMRRGVDGFRVDASAVLAEDDLLRDDPPNPDADEKLRHRSDSSVSSPMTAASPCSICRRCAKSSMNSLIGCWPARCRARPTASVTSMAAGPQPFPLATEFCAA